MRPIHRVFVWLVVSAAAVTPLSAVEAGTRSLSDSPVAGIVRRALPSMVVITTRQIGYDGSNQPVPSRGLGSGFIVDRRGYVLTNYHVIEGAEQIKVMLTDERIFPARVVGTDPSTDLAVLKIDGAGLSAVRLGSSTGLSVGEPVIAIGSPLWIDGGPSVTTGVVSGLGRSIEEAGLPVLHDLIQTDAAINPGNSGGPLLNRAGDVVGINTAIIPSAHGISFAIAIDTVKPVIRTLLAGGRVVRPTLGLRAITVTPQVAFTNDLPVDRGALVTTVEPEGPAAQGGIEPGDIVIAVHGRPVRGLHELHEALRRRRAGDVVLVTVRRGAGVRSVSAVLGEEP